MHIHGFNKTTLLDYPQHLASTIFIGGCNFRCPFCHNASLVTNVSSQPTIAKEDVMQTLKDRKNFLEGVCITGGEPTIYPELPNFIKEIKALGLKVKLDTNGTNPNMIKYLVDKKLIDYIAMDLKNSKQKYYFSAGVPSLKLDDILKTVDYLMADPIEYEFRTTIVKEHHTAADIISMGEWIKGAKLYFLQSYKDSGDVIQTGLSPHNNETLHEFIGLLKPYVPSAKLRGID